MKRIFTFILGLVCITNMFSQTTFSNAATITIPSVGSATPYPSSIVVSGMGTSITNITVTLTNVTHTFPADIDVMLVAPNGDRFVFMSDRGGTAAITNRTYTFSDAAATLFPTGTAAAGTYRPANSTVPDTWTPLAADVATERATPGGAETFATRFNGDNPNGTWSLYVVDDATGDAGTIGGWSITVTAPLPPPTVTGFSPSSACAGSTVVTITGTNFTGATAVNFNGIPASSFTVVNPTTITAVPAAATVGTISVTTGSGTATSAGSITVLSSPAAPTAVTSTPATLCSPGGSTNLNATSAGNTIQWYTVPIGGVSIGSSASGANFTFTTTTTTTYYAEAFNGVCAGARTPITVTVNASPVVSATATPSGICAGSSSVLNVPIVSFTPYCQPNNSTGCSFPDIISNVTFGGINRSSGCDNTGGGGYSLFVSPTASITAGATIPYSVTTGGDVEGAAMWIDYNQDGVFAPSEQIFNGFANTNPATYSGSTTIPLTAINGTTRMRVRCIYNANPNGLANPPCTAVTFGETEDYPVTITGGVNANTNPATWTWNPGGLSGQSVTVSPALTTTYTVTSTAPSGCTNTATVTVNVDALPVLSCPGNQTASANASCQAIVSYTATASVGTLSYTFTGATTGSGSGSGSGSTFNRGVTTVTITSTNGSCSTSCNFTVTVNDVTSPVLTLPSSITVSNSPGTCSAVVSYSSPTATDNCTPFNANFNYSGPAIPLPDLATTTSTISTSGLSNGLGSSVILNSVCINLNHTFTGDLSINLISPIGTVYNLVGNEGGGGDNFTNTCFSMSAGTSIVGQAAPFTGTFIPEGVGGFATYNGQNPNGIWTLSVVDGAGGDFGTLFNWSLSFTNVSPAITQTSGLASGSSFPVGVTTNTFVSTDAAGNTTTSSFTVTVNDIEAPTISCPANMNQTNSIGNCDTIVTYTAPIGTDNCSGATTTQIAGLASGSSFPVGVTTNIFRVTDASGNSSTCSFTVTITDTENPTVICPADISVGNNAGVCGAIVSFTPTGSDNCSSVSFLSNFASGGTFPVGTTTVTVTATDASGNTDVCSFNVTVNDTENPVAICPADITQSNDPGACGAVVTFTANFTDNCAGGSVVTVPASGSTFPVGTTPVTVTATDAAGNTNVCSFDVVVNDTENPVAICPADITQNSDPGICGAVVTFTANFTDNCAGGSVLAVPASGSTFPVGTTPVTVTATDAAGNTNVCSFDVTVNDIENPTVICPADITVNNDAGVCGAVVSFTPTATDNCSGVSLSSSPASGSTFAVGTTTVTVTATDGAGNTDVCSFDITVNDTQGPTIVCSAPVVLNVSCTPATIASLTPPTGFDNCGGPVTYSNNYPSVTYPLGLTSVIWTATDALGNTSICTQTVTITSPEAHITGNGWAVSAGAVSVSLVNNTDFGNVPVCSTFIDRTYLFRNLGTGNITLPGSPNTVAISGANAADYSIITQPAPGTVIPPGGSVNITVRFDPSVAGFRNARVTVLNTDCNEAIYWFAIRGRGIACAAFMVPDPSGQSTSDGNTSNNESGESLGLHEDEEIAVNIYPNPSDGRFTLELSDMPTGKAEFRMLNDLGQVIYSNELMSQSMYYDFSYLRAGTYYVQVIGENTFFTKTIIITQKY